MGIHVTGASGAGTTTLGRALARRTGAVHLDTDEFYWLPVEPAYSEKRPIPERLALLNEAFAHADPRGWILSGSVSDWGAPLIPRFDLVVFLFTPTDIRIARLRAREAKQFGAAAIAPGGARHDEHEDFIRWAAGYDTGTEVSRSLAKHEAWLAALPCPVVRLDGSESVEVLVEKAAAAMPRRA
jgi:adenylate kinase family enzyme